MQSKKFLKKWMKYAEGRFQHLKVLLEEINKKSFSGEGIVTRLMNLRIISEGLKDSPQLYDYCESELVDISRKVEELAKEYGINYSSKSSAPIPHKKEETKMDKHIIAVNNYRYLSMEDKDLNEVKSFNNIEPIQEKQARLDIKPEIYLSRYAYNKLLIWSKLLDIEVACMGLVELDAGLCFQITDFFLFPQIASTVSVDKKSDDSFIKWYMALEKEGVDLNKLKCWAHSHHKFIASPSQQDIETSKEFGAGSNSYLISLIINHKKEFHTKINFYKPIEICIEDVPLYIYDPEIGEKFIKERKAEIKKYVEKREYVTPPNQFGYGLYRPPYDHDYENLDHVYGSDTPVRSSITGKNDDKESHSRERQLERLSSGLSPFGQHFIENSVRYKWNYRTYQYLSYLFSDFKEENEIDAVKLAELGAVNYNIAVSNLMEELKKEHKEPKDLVMNR